MKFMGDYPLRGQTEQDVVCHFLKVLCSSPKMHVRHRLTVLFDTVPQLIGEYGLLKDEAYCQVLKQITANTSSKSDSCQRGWRLLYILTAYHRCSEVLKPYLLKFLHDICKGPGVLFQGIAKVCEQNLRKTFQYGGRSVFPSSIELKAMVAGRSSKRQLFLFPGGIERHLKIKTCSIALDVIEELCYEMGLHRVEAMDEYAIFVVANKGQNVRPLNKKEYILDIATEAEQIDSSYTFWFRRVIWSQPLKFDNELSVTMHFNQVLPDYLKALLNVLPQDKVSEQQFQQVCKLAALQHRAKDSIYLPTIREVQECVPSKLFGLQRPQQWLNTVTQHMQQVQPLSPHQARAQFLGKKSNFYAGFMIVIQLLCPLVRILMETMQTLCFFFFLTHEFSGGDGEADSRLQFPLRGGHAGRSNVPPHYPAAARTGTTGRVSHSYFPVFPISYPVT
uniref:MyTH4 domain-containing protein n=1 Tax=Scleropages formosus TaxID=113540 RepID=A0A8C9R7C9_SCLFO